MLKVTVITATYNAAATIASAVQSVKRQTYPNIEHIIVDGLSQDNTIQIALSAGFEGKYISERDHGIYHAMNKGIHLATGDIVAILNADDFYAHENVIKNVVEKFETSECDAVYGDLCYVDAANIQQIKRKWLAGNYHPGMMLRGWMPPHPTFIIKRSCYNQFGVFNLDLWGSADYELMLRMIHVHKIKLAYIAEVMVYMRSGGQSNKSLKNRIKAHSEDYKAWKINGIQPKWFTLVLKPLRKITQFFVIRKMYQQ